VKNTNYRAKPQEYPMSFLNCTIFILFLAAGALAVETPHNLHGNWMVHAEQVGTSALVPREPELLCTMTATQRVICQDVAVLESANTATDQKGRTITVLTFADAPTTWSVTALGAEQFSLTINFPQAPLRFLFTVNEPR
jgi:hypothetical protein